MAAEVFELVLDVFFADIDVFGGGDAVNDQLGLDVFLGAVFLTLPKTDPVQIYRAGIDALLGKRSHDALKAHVFLVLHEGFRNGEVMPLYKFENNLFPL